MPKATQNIPRKLQKGTQNIPKIGRKISRRHSKENKYITYIPVIYNRQQKQLNNQFKLQDVDRKMI